MKKQLYLSLFFIFFSASLQIMQAEPKGNALADDPAYIETKNYVAFIQGNIPFLQRSQTKRGRNLGIETGAGVGSVLGVPPLMESHSFKEVGKWGGFIALSTATGAAVGTAVGGGVSEVQRRVILGRINSILQMYTPYNFAQLPIDPAVMIWATYKKDLSLMKKVRPYVRSFLRRKNVWDALTHFYFGEVTPEKVEQLKRMLE